VAPNVELVPTSHDPESHAIPNEPAGIDLIMDDWQISLGISTESTGNVSQFRQVDLHPAVSVTEKGPPGLTEDDGLQTFR